MKKYIYGWRVNSWLNSMVKFYDCYFECFLKVRESIDRDEIVVVNVVFCSIYVMFDCIKCWYFLFLVW